MAVDLRLTENGVELISLTSGDCLIDNNGWKQNPQLEGEWTADNIDVSLHGGLEAIDSSKQILTRALYQATRYQNEGAGYPIYLEGRRSASEGWKRSRLKGGSLDEYDLDAATSTGSTLAHLSIERQNFFDGALTELPLTNLNGSNITGGIQIYNCNDQTGTSPNRRCNYVQISGDDIEGEIPAGCRITVAGDAFTNAYYGAGNDYDLTLQTTLEGETLGGGAAHSDSSCSGGSYTSLTGGSWYVLSNKAKGQSFWPFARARIISDQDIHKVALRVDQGLTRTNYPSLDPSAFQLIPLGFVHIPNAYTPDGLTATLLITFGTLPEDLDYLQLLPVNAGWRLVEGDGAEGNDGLIDDALEGFTYLTVAGISHTSSISGPGVQITPGKDHQISFLFSEPVITKAETITVSYRPRYRML